MAWLTFGAEMTSPSSSMEMVLPTFSAVAVAKAVAPSSLSVNCTTGWPSR